MAAPPMTDFFMYPQDTWSSSSWAAFRFPHRSFGWVTKALLISLNRDTNRWIRCQQSISHRFKSWVVFVTVANFLWAEEGRGLKYIVWTTAIKRTVSDLDWNSNPVSQKIFFWRQTVGGGSSPFQFQFETLVNACYAEKYYYNTKQLFGRD